MLIASDLAAIIIVVASTVFVVVVVLALHIWGAIQDGVGCTYSISPAYWPDPVRG
jgi:hypothetical protein